MWPNSKGKGGKGSSKSNDGDDEKPRSKPRATRTKLKAMTAEAARALQDTGETSVKPRMSPEELLEAEIFRAAEQASADQVAREEQANSHTFAGQSCRYGSGRASSHKCAARVDDWHSRSHVRPVSEPCL